MNYKLAKQLKDLNYPQPKFEFGQKWVNEHDLFLVLYVFDDDITFWRKEMGVTNLYSLTKLNEHIDLCYIPTFEKLWKALPEYILNKGDLTLSSAYGLCYNKTDYFDSDIQDYNQHDINILEAAAKMWILLKEKNLI